MAGIPGAGKSTFVARERSAGRLSKQAFVVNPDAVMEMPAAYVADVNAHGPAAAFARWEMPARTFAHALLDEARAKGLNAIQDTACARHDNVETLREFKSDGYEVWVWYVECSVDVAAERIALREAETGRHTPLAMVFERAEAIKQLMPEIRAVCDHFNTV